MSARTLSVPFRALMWVYAIVPILSLVAGADLLIAHGALRSFLPRDPEHFFLYLLLFNVPHHVGSLLSFADAEYLKHYRRRLLTTLPLVWTATALCFFFAPLLALVIFIVYTEYHTLNQQIGIGGAFIRTRLAYLSLWRWSTVAIMALFYAATTYPTLIPAAAGHAAAVFGIAVSIMQAGVTLLLYRQIETSHGKSFFLAISMSLAGAAWIMALGYPLLSALMTRFIHDVTAFMVYAVHDRNRNHERRHNVIYRALSFLPIPVLVLVPLVAVLIAAPLTFGLAAGSLVLMLLFMTHYYVEGIIWRRGTIHRAHLTFAP
ncbi:MAG: hypothetical protein ACM3TU_02575 [Bacillota bacterium]